MRGARGILLVPLVGVLQWSGTVANVNFDGGRSDLPGMRQDMFDQAKKNKKAGPGARSRAQPDCPKSDQMSPFVGLAFVNGELFVKINSSDEKCQRLDTVGGANYSVLANASRTCGPVGEWKKRIAEELSAVFFQGGLEWVKHDGEMIEVVTEEGEFQSVVSEDKYKEMMECWARGCSCEQANNPVGRAVLFTLAAIAAAGLLMDSGKVAWDKIRGKKPEKHVLCPKGNRMEEVKFLRTHICDVCRRQGTEYQSSGGNYDMCKSCYKGAKKKLKTQLEEWYKKYPAEKAKDDEKKEKKKKAGDKDADSEAEQSKAESRAESEAESTARPESEKADSKEGESTEKEGESSKNDDTEKEEEEEEEEEDEQKS